MLGGQRQNHSFEFCLSADDALLEQSLGKKFCNVVFKPVRRSKGSVV
jgi:hypothetical protein